VLERVQILADTRQRSPDVLGAPPPALQEALELEVAVNAEAQRGGRHRRSWGRGRTPPVASVDVSVEDPSEVAVR